MIEVTLTSGDVRQWGKDEYTEYDIKGRFFVIINNGQWVGMYALDSIVAVEVDEEEDGAE